ncbi:hypothetical protein K490DRAFT_60492 [Saccharata proteae CBS 121410]|uniref:Secreted protein n=1 Tax=Saccharata proteae CBS 121410 TaxID=1314787 RepID=A0A9P4HMT8_9PEZI|nr:hypothetical protein K490DRAFT_60492 [Saccharata proteae CBS 121410]
MLAVLVLVLVLVLAVLAVLTDGKCTGAAGRGAGRRVLPAFRRVGWSTTCLAGPPAQKLRKEQIWPSSLRLRMEPTTPEFRRRWGWRCISINQQERESLAAHHSIHHHSQTSTSSMPRCLDASMPRCRDASMASKHLQSCSHCPDTQTFSTCQTAHPRITAPSAREGLTI